jgi:hypothetical protein
MRAVTGHPRAISQGSARSLTVNRSSHQCAPPLPKIPYQAGVPRGAIVRARWVRRSATSSNRSGQLACNRLAATTASERLRTRLGTHGSEGPLRAVACPIARPTMVNHGHTRPETPARAHSMPAQVTPTSPDAASQLIVSQCLRAQHFGDQISDQRHASAPASRSSLIRDVCAATVPANTVAAPTS